MGHVASKTISLGQMLEIPYVPPGSLVKCLTGNPRVLSSHSGSSRFIVALQSPSLVLVKPRKDMNNVNYRRDMTEILLKAVLNTIQPINPMYALEATFSVR